MSNVEGKSSARRGETYHVIAKLHVAQDDKGCSGGVKGHNLEDHNSHHATRPDEAGDKSGNNVGGGSHVAHCHHDSDWYDDDGIDGKNEDNAIPGKAGIVVLDKEDRQAKGNDQHRREPPQRNLGVPTHESAMNIFVD